MVRNHVAAAWITSACCATRFTAALSSGDGVVRVRVVLPRRQVGVGARQVRNERGGQLALLQRGVGHAQPRDGCRAQTEPVQCRPQLGAPCPGQCRPVDRGELG